MLITSVINLNQYRKVFSAITLGLWKGQCSNPFKLTSVNKVATDSFIGLPANFK